MTTAPLQARSWTNMPSHASSLPAGVVSADRRQEAIQALAGRGLPTTRDENWRYSNLRPLERARFVPVDAVAAAQALPAGSELPSRLEGFARYTFVDGVFAAGAVLTRRAARG